MKNSVMSILGLLAGGLLLMSPAMAESRLPVTAETSGMEKVLSIIGKTSLAQTDQKMQQSMLDMLEMKSQLYLGGKTQPSKTAKKAPPARPGKR